MTDYSPGKVACPTCKTQLEWTTENPHRPFCSDRCRNKDFICWANETSIIQGNPDYDDLLSDDLFTKNVSQ